MPVDQIPQTQEPSTIHKLHARIGIILNIHVEGYGTVGAFAHVAQCLGAAGQDQDVEDEDNKGCVDTSSLIRNHVIIYSLYMLLENGVGHSSQNCHFSSFYS